MWYEVAKKTNLVSCYSNLLARYVYKIYFFINVGIRVNLRAS